MTPDGILIHEKRLHPLTLAYRLLRALPGTVFSIVVAFQFGGFENWYLIIVLLLAGFISTPFAVLNYYFYSYAVTEKDLVIRSGVLNKSIRTIPVHKIQNIAYEQNFLQRLLKITKLQIETAGDSKTEGMLEFISLAEAENIKNVIHAAKRGETAAVTADEIPSVPEPKVLFRLSLKEAFIFGMVRFRPLVFLFLIWAFSIVSQPFANPFLKSFKSDIDNLESQVETIFTQESAGYIALILLLTFLVAVILGWIADILMTVNKYYNFTLSEENGKLFTSQGLLATRRTSLPLNKLQMLTLITNPIRKKFGYYGLEIQTAGFASDKGKSAESVIPFSKYMKILDLSQKIHGFELPEKFNPISRKAIRKAFFRYCLFLAVLIIPLLFISKTLLWLFLILPLAYFPALIRFQHRGYHIEADKLMIKQGFWNEKAIIVPLVKIQTINKTSTIFQRRLGLASLVIDTAAGSIFADCKIADISAEDADRIMDEIETGFRQSVNPKKFAVD